MPTSDETGRSWRTPAKHAIMDKLVGQETGAARHMPTLNRHCWLDLTAGDAVVDIVDGQQWHEACSPGLLAYHAVRAHKPVRIDLHEQKPRTFDRLITNLAAELMFLRYRRVTDTSWSFGDRVHLYAHLDSGHRVDVSHFGASDAVLMFNDPNAITTWAVRDSFGDDVQQQGVWAYRSLSTLGCNVGGIKRLEFLEKRAEWFNHVETQQRWNPHYRNMLLAAIDGDASQWAYLITTANKWRAEAEQHVRESLHKIKRTAVMAWAYDDPASEVTDGAYEDLKRYLFLTSQERRDGVA